MGQNDGQVGRSSCRGVPLVSAGVDSGALAVLPPALELALLARSNYVE